MNIQQENSKLSYEVRRLQNENAKLKGKATAPVVDAATQVSRPIASTLAGWAAPPPGFGATPLEFNDGYSASRAVKVVLPPRPNHRVNAQMQTQWEEFGGDLIEPLVRSGCVAFVDATVCVAPCGASTLKPTD